jgi:CRP/FNR family transcriptional regulator, cyclic AMP receptor protein
MTPPNVEDEHMKELNFEPGEVVFEAGNSSNCAYLVESGEFEVSRIHNGQKQIVGTLKEKDIFGEMGILDDQPRSATVVALKKSTVSLITRECFQSIERTNPQALMPLLRVLSTRIRNSFKRVHPSA